MKKLFYSQNSPYARIARISLIESGLAAEFNQIKVINRSPNSPILDYNSVGRVPTLVHDQLIITEAKYICAYINQLSGNKSPTINKPDWNSLSQEGQIIGFLDGIAFWVRENRRDETARSSFLLEVEQQRAFRCLKSLEKSTAQYTPRNFATIALACALDLMAFNQLMPNWKKISPTLYAWYTEQITLPSMIETAPS